MSAQYYKWLQPGEVMFVNIDNPPDMIDAETFDYLNETGEADNYMNYWEWLECLERGDIPSQHDRYVNMEAREFQFWGMVATQWADHVYHKEQ